jgi:hypothetical protein
MPPAAEPLSSAPPRREEEVDLWWGSYSGLAMVPSFAVCIVLTAGLYFGARLWVPQRGWLQLTFTALTSLVWLVQLARLGHRCFTYNYRLTSRFVYIDRGFWPLVAKRVELRSIERVTVERDRFTGWLGVGDLNLWLAGSSKQPVVLRALTSTAEVAQTVRTALEKSRLES